MKQQCDKDPTQFHHKIYTAFLEREVFWQSQVWSGKDEEELVEKTENLVKLTHK